ncbi:Protein CBG21388 [Caenorhabditis briggsae]|uniref:Protein CBG21388 n=1 Tax=Caenorhabditis briggsae TaxID=6238 RepID=A8XZZ2_CAEBR|nr:Protein CBG21388 [Caenorhabditis briggsae]CAP38209.2 Protein CBG21388 [Caenorhabditis briggsae]
MCPKNARKAQNAHRKKYNFLKFSDQAKARNYDSNRRLMARIEKLKAKNGHLNDSDQSSQNQEEIARFQAKIQGAAKEIERLRLANETLSNKMSNGSDEHLQKRIDALTVELNEQKSKFANLHESNRRLIAKLDVANDRNKELLKMELVTFRNQPVRNRDTVKTVISKSSPPNDYMPIANLKLEISQLSENLKTEKSKIASREAEIQNLTKINDKLEKEANNLVDENRRLKNEIHDLKEEIEDSQCSTSSEATSSEVYEERLRSQAEMIKDLEEQLRHSEEGPPAKMRKISSDGLLEENQRLQKTIKSFMEVQASSEKNSEKIQNLEKEISRLQAENKKIIDESESDNLRMMDENSDLLDEIEFHVNQIRLKEMVFEAEKAKILKKLEAEQSEISRLQEENQRLLEALNSENSKLEAAESEAEHRPENAKILDENRKVLENWKAEQSEILMKISRLQDEHQNQELSHLRDENQRQEDVIQNQHQEISRLQDLNQNRKEEVSRLLEALETENTKFEAEKAEILKELSRLQEENQRLEDLIQNQQQRLQDTIQNQEEEISRLQDENQNPEVSRLQDENQRHQDMILNQRQEISRLLETLKSENSTFEAAESEAQHARQLAVIQNQKEKISRLLEAVNSKKSKFEAEKSEILATKAAELEAHHARHLAVVQNLFQEKSRNLETIRNLEAQKSDILREASEKIAELDVRLQTEIQNRDENSKLQKTLKKDSEDSEFSRLQEENESLRETIQKQNSEILKKTETEHLMGEFLNAQDETSPSREQDIAQKTSEDESLQAENQRLRAENQRLRAENLRILSSKNAVNDELETRHLILLSENASLLDSVKNEEEKARHLEASEHNHDDKILERLPEISGRSSPEAVRAAITRSISTDPANEQAEKSEKVVLIEKIEALNVEIFHAKLANFELRQKADQTCGEVNRLMSELEIHKSLIGYTVTEKDIVEKTLKIKELEGQIAHLEESHIKLTTEHHESLAFAWAQVKHLDVKLKTEKEKFDEMVSQKLGLLAENPITELKACTEFGNWSVI